MQILKNLNAKQRLVVFILGILLSIFLLALLRGIIEEKMYRDAVALHLNQIRSGEFRSESGFRDLRWGAPSSELPGMESIGKYTQGKQILAQYRRADEELNFEGVPLRAVVYEFIVDNDVEAFFSGIMFLDNSSGRYSKQIWEILDRRYGVYESATDTSMGPAVYRYVGQYTDAIYAPDSNEVGGFIIIIGSEMYELWLDISGKGFKR